MPNLSVVAQRRYRSRNVRTTSFGRTPSTSTKLSIVLVSNVAVSVSTSRYRSAALAKLGFSLGYTKTNRPHDHRFDGC